MFLQIPPPLSVKALPCQGPEASMPSPTDQNVILVFLLYFYFMSISKLDDFELRILCIL